MNITKGALPRWLKEGRGDIYFLGIGGSGMYGVARLALAMGFGVRGSDARETPNTASLRRLGVPLYREEESLPREVFLLVYSLAVPMSHPRILEAKAQGIPVMDRAAFFGILMRAFPKRAAVSGSHGKSSTTAMCAEILQRAGLSPTVVSGAALTRGEDSFREGEGDLLLFEACEYRNAFLSFSPTHVLVLSVSWEHTDCFADFESVKNAFSAFINGKSVRASVAPWGLFSSTVSFGEGGEYTARDCRETREGSEFLLCKNGAPVGRVSLSTIGAYQVENALGAAALCATLGVSDKDITDGLSSFTGIARRMEKRGYLRGIPLYLDFAHHPKELASVLKAASRFARPIAVVFEPHTYSRTKAFFEEYVRLLRIPHIAGVLPVYAAREEPDPSFTSERLSCAAGIAFLPDYAHAAEFLTNAAGKGCTLLLIGAGGVEGVLSHLPHLLPNYGV